MEATKWKAEKDVEQSNSFSTLEVEEGLETRKEENEEERKNKKKTENSPNYNPPEMKMEISRRLKENKTNYTKVRVVKNGIEVDHETEENYRKMTVYMRKKNFEFYIFEKPLKVALKEIPHEKKGEDIKEDLESNNLKVQS